MLYLNKVKKKLVGHLFLSPSADGKQRTPRKRQNQKVRDTWVQLERESCSLARSIHVVEWFVVQWLGPV